MAQAARNLPRGRDQAWRTNILQKQAGFVGLQQEWKQMMHSPVGMEKLLLDNCKDEKASCVITAKMKILHSVTLLTLLLLCLQHQKKESARICKQLISIVIPLTTESQAPASTFRN